MTTSLGTDVAGTVHKMFDALERGDLQELRSYMEPDCLTWHNYDEVEQDVDLVIATLGNLCDISTSRTYEDRRITAYGSVVISQHVLTARLSSGDSLRMPAMMRIQFTAEGRVQRLDEYFDSRAIDVLAEQ